MIPITKQGTTMKKQGQQWNHDEQTMNNNGNARKKQEQGTAITRE